VVIYADKMLLTSLTHKQKTKQLQLQKSIKWRQNITVTILMQFRLAGDFFTSEHLTSLINHAITNKKVRIC